MKKHLSKLLLLGDCLNSDIRSHQQLKVALKNAYPEKSRIIDSTFNLYGF